ncbi:MAG: LL-diaminopimelate aminotransferase [Christensenellaceae bacterium]|jgi:LL-diaminopimelate aminotransferase|nr:LL-diaminopimelate aminotransferase [Christensenellaceae bacterium]
MVRVNTNYKNLKQNYLFANIAKKLSDYTAAHPTAKIIKMGIGDVTQPLSIPVVEALVKASFEMGVKETFRGYAPDEQGYSFLKLSIADYYKNNSNVDLDEREIFVSDGAKSDVANFTDLFSNDNTIIIPDPVYPVYLDSNIMLGRKIILINGNDANGFLPLPTEGLQGDIIYLCSPNNPTGAVYTKDQLKQWVDFAIDRNAVILFDAAYEAFISDSDLPRSIYEIPDAKRCAVEFCSLSKTAGFTGTRCGYTIVPEELIVDGESLNNMWMRRQTTKFNGTAYIIQRAAEAVFSKEGLESCKTIIDYYRGNAKIMTDTMSKLSIWHTGGLNSPYVWMKCGMDSWEYFDTLLNDINIVGTPGSGFGRCGAGYFRLTAFNTRENTIEAMERFSKLFK